MRANLYEEFHKAGRLDSKGRIPLHDGLEGVNFEGANLESADLTNADLWGANLTGAYLRFADLINADLWKANLTGANFSVATLYKTSLRDANLTKAHLQDAHLMSPDLTGAQPWQAVLFRSADMTTEQYPDERKPLETIENLLGEIRHLKNLHPTSLLYFRGESKFGWELRPSAMRDGFAASESDMLVDLISRRPEEFNGMISALAQWVLAQHHGLRTRFLDITKKSAGCPLPRL